MSNAKNVPINIPAADHFFFSSSFFLFFFSLKNVWTQILVYCIFVILHRLKIWVNIPNVLGAQKMREKHKSGYYVCTFVCGK